MKKFWETFKLYAKYVGFGMIGLVFVVMLLFIIKLQYDANDKQTALNKSVVEMKHLNDGIVRSQSKYVTKEDLKKFGEDINLDEIKKDLDDLDAEIKGISKILITSLGEKQTNQPSHHWYPNTDPSNPTDPIPGSDDTCKDGKKSWCVSDATSGYLENAQVMNVSEKFKNQRVPFGSVTFKAWKNNPWDIEVYRRDYKISSVLSEDRDGRHYLHHKFTINSNGKDHTVEIKDAKYAETLPEARWEWWNPKIGMGLTAGVSLPTSGLSDKGVSGSVSPSLYFSPFSYGKTRPKPDWVFAQVGVGYESIGKAAQFSLSPAMYNLGSVIDIINNSYVGPTISVDTKSNVTLGGTVAVTF